MGTDQSTAGDQSLGIENPHCGVCQHMYFRADWDRTPYCSKREQTIEIQVGDVCSEFAFHRGLDVEQLDADVDANIDADIDGTEMVRGTEAPFYAAYREEELYGWLCENCRTLDVVSGPMKQLVCTQCENTSQPTEWDAAYL